MNIVKKLLLSAIVIAGATQTGVTVGNHGYDYDGREYSGDRGYYRGDYDRPYATDVAADVAVDTVDAAADVTGDVVGGVLSGRRGRGYERRRDGGYRR
ncbi:MAG TPA: hypothetical protein VGT41_06885 [Candidatus Babeliales bacterium]|nr:hypothetical protein [Candidatus Babeliales bacterium]